LLGELPRLVAAFANYHWAGEASCDQEWFVAEVTRSTVRVDEHGAMSFAAVSAREHVECDTALLEKFTEHYYERGLA
jgi:hypothetical protein